VQAVHRVEWKAKENGEFRKIPRLHWCDYLDTGMVFCEVKNERERGDSELLCHRDVGQPC
jgi:hypothetical protein